MADEKYNIEVAVKAHLEALNKVQDAIGEINKNVGVLSGSTSNLSNVWTGAMMNIGARISDAHNEEAGVDNARRSDLSHVFSGHLKQ